jgi:CBS domain-containing protein
VISTSARPPARAEALDCVGHRHLLERLEALGGQPGGAVAGDDVEPERGHQRDARPPRTLSVALEDHPDEALLTGGVDVVDTGIHRRADHRLAGLGEGAGAVDQHVGALEQGGERAGVVHGGHPHGRPLGALAGDALEPLAATAAEHEVHAATHQLVDHEPARVPGGSVEDDGHGAATLERALLARAPPCGYGRAVRVDEIMTHAVITAEVSEALAGVGALMRDHGVGSVVIVDGGRPVGVLTDRDLALAVVADGVEPSEPAQVHMSRPLVTGHTEMDIEEAAALMVENRIRRLPLRDGELLSGIVTIDDLAVRVGDLELAQGMTAEVARAALPGFYFRQRGG